MKIDLKKITEELIPVFDTAGLESINLYKKGLKIEIKEDGSPVSNGDLKVNELIENEIISGGMIPKIKNCIDVASNGVKGVVIIDGRKNHSILFELLSDKGSGTLIRK